MQPETDAREIRIKIPRLRMPSEKGPAIVAIAAGTFSCIVVTYLLGQINDLKKQQESAEERIKEEVLMPGGTTTYKTEFKPDPKVDTAKDPVVEVAPAPAPAPAAAPAPAPAPAPPAPPQTGPGNYGSYSPPSYSGPTGPGNM